MKNNRLRYASRKLMVIAVCTCMALSYGTALMARGIDMDQGKWWERPRLAHDLNLTNEDKQALDNLSVQHRKACGGLRGSLKAEQRNLADILGKDKVTKKEALKQFNKVENMKQKLAAERFEYMFGIRNVLGPDRFNQLMAKFQDFRSRHHPHGGKGSGHEKTHCPG